MCAFVTAMGTRGMWNKRKVRCTRRTRRWGTARMVFDGSREEWGEKRNDDGGVFGYMREEFEDKEDKVEREEKVKWRKKTGMMGAISVAIWMMNEVIGPMMEVALAGWWEIKVRIAAGGTRGRERYIGRRVRRGEGWTREQEELSEEERQIRDVNNTIRKTAQSASNVVTQLLSALRLK